jgi:hypothetical protein
VGADQVANLRYVSLGSANGERIEVLSGVEAGERIVARPGAENLAGRKLEEAR